MSDKFFVDTNILMYAHDTAAGAKHESARSPSSKNYGATGRAS